tara:strand:- start:72 stop:623 length:552 start_codon:yes stop_codon:yes gene_type:complete
MRQIHNKKFYGGVVIPDEFICPISQELMMDPVSTTTLFHFERDCIQHWLDLHGTCPMTRNVMPTDANGNYPLFPLPNLQQAIRDFISLHADDTDVHGSILEDVNIDSPPKGPQYVGKYVELSMDTFEKWIEIELTRNNPYLDPNEDPENRFLVLGTGDGMLSLEHVQGALADDIDPNDVTFVL